MPFKQEHSLAGFGFTIKKIKMGSLSIALVVLVLD